jgi:multiple sugar transport system substrate-binding protein
MFQSLFGKCSILLASLFLMAWNVCAIEVIHLGLPALDESHKRAYNKIISDFEQQNPDIKIRIRTLPGDNFTKRAKSFKDSQNQVDVFTWFGGKRLEKLVDEDAVYPLDELWIKQDLDNAFSSATKDKVHYKKHFFGLPVAYYSWGFYYKKSLFKRLKLTKPDTWSEFLDVLSTLKKQQITPIAIGTKEPWPAAAWFDYLLLRSYSFDFYQRVMNGQVAYDSPEIKTIFSTWQVLVDNDYFTAAPEKFDSEKLISSIYREISGVQLIGSFALQNLPKEIRSELGYFAFPTMNSKERNEISPLSILSISKNSSRKDEALRFLNYMSKTSVQEYLNREKATLSPLVNARASNQTIIAKGQFSLTHADNLSQYFDRETTYEMAKFAKEAFAEFIVDGDIEKITQQLENMRQQVFFIKQ